MNQMQKKEDTYKEVRTFTYPNAVVRVHMPDLTPDERNRRMRKVEKAAADLLKSVERRANEKLV